MINNKGKLIALDGTGGSAMITAAKRLQKYYKGAELEPGISRWDASGLFYDLLQGRKDEKGACPRTILLLYAADLLFRLRWQIGPALEEGITVIATPYVETAVAFGRAAGLSRVWLQELFAFAPRAEATYRVVEDRITEVNRGKPSNSFFEFSLMQLRKGSGEWVMDDVRTAFHSHLKTLERRGKCRPASARVLAGTVAVE